MFSLLGPVEGSGQLSKGPSGSLGDEWSADLPPSELQVKNVCDPFFSADNFHCSYGGHSFFRHVEEVGTPAQQMAKMRSVQVATVAIKRSSVHSFVIRVTLASNFSRGQ